MRLIVRYALIYLTMLTLCGHAVQRIAAAGAEGDAIFWFYSVIRGHHNL